MNDSTGIYMSRICTTEHLVSDVERGLRQDEFFFLLQPKLELQECGVSGFECLIRWQHPVRGVLEPTSFISLVEDSFLARRFTDILIRRAARLLTQWKAAGRDDLSVAINLSSVELGSRDFPGRLSSLIRSLDIDPSRFEIELTDVVHPDRLDWLVEVIHAAQAIGVRVALDDFGAGFNSLTLLQQLPVDLVKFDRSLIKDVVSNDELTRTIHTLIDLAKNHGKRIVITGLETAEQFEWAKTLPGVEAQGFFISEPLREAEVDDFIGRSRHWTDGAR
jgi:EAL domain-containing protein (putative c-di-GMP-specific phosphodiesterase class I)